MLVCWGKSSLQFNIFYFILLWDTVVGCHGLPPRTSSSGIKTYSLKSLGDVAAHCLLSWLFGDCSHREIRPAPSLGEAQLPHQPYLGLLSGVRLASEGSQWMSLEPALQLLPSSSPVLPPQPPLLQGWPQVDALLFHHHLRISFPGNPILDTCGCFLRRWVFPILKLTSNVSRLCSVKKW